MQKLWDWIDANCHEDNFNLNDAREMSLKLEKEQIKECWNTAHQAGRFEGKGIAEENWQTFEQYYNETYKK